MHIYTLVITPGPRRSAVRRAENLLAKAVPRYCDHWGTGGSFEDRLGKVARPEIEAWYEGEDERRERFEAEHPPGDATDQAYDLRELQWSSQEEPHRQRLRHLEDEALIDRARLTSELPSPLEESMVPAALVTPEGRWRMRPVTWEQGDPRWARWVDETTNRYRGGHCVVVADCHC